MKGNITSEQLDTFEADFRNMDTNNDNTVSKEELKAFITKAMGL
jgi:hypothetical protein